MKFGDFFAMLKEQPYFDLATVAQLSREPRRTLRTQLYRWVKAGRLLSLRRGMYAFAEPYRRLALNPASLSNHIYKPSYLSTFWALGYYGLIPERVTLFSAVTTRVPREFTNAFGVFRYSNLKRTFFFGYKAISMDDQEVLLAEPEKALLDFWHLERGEWDRDRSAEMRYQSFELVNEERIADYAARFNSPRILRALDQWRALARTEEGTVEP